MLADQFDDARRRMAFMFFQYTPIALDPGVEHSRYSTHTRRVLRITDWAQNKKGQPGNLCHMARELAHCAKEREAAVWARMKGEEDYVVVSPNDKNGFKMVLPTLQEE